MAIPQNASLRVWRVASLVSFLALGLSAPSLADPPAAGWERLDVAQTGSYVWRYIPASLDRQHPASTILFLHGAGSTPDVYKNFVASAAETAGAVLILPKSLGTSWGSGADEATLAAAVAAVGAELPLDPDRLALAGHSAGGAYAYLVAYASSLYSALFTLAAPFYAVPSLTDPVYRPPIRMYYGSTDPNYTGAEPLLKAQWDRLGVKWEEEVQAGFGHNSWPNSSMRAGFQFLVAQTRAPAATLCTPAADVLCLRGGRFKAEVGWEAGGAQGRGMVVPNAGDGSGLFWFFAPENWELMVKVLDGCAVNGHYWVFSAATSDVHYRLEVTDRSTGRSAVYENRAGDPAKAVTDTSALEVCP